MCNVFILCLRESMLSTDWVQSSASTSPTRISIINVTQLLSNINVFFTGRKFLCVRKTHSLGV
jgi:hypothetical protein